MGKIRDYVVEVWETVVGIYNFAGYMIFGPEEEQDSAFSSRKKKSMLETDNDEMFAAHNVPVDETDSDQRKQLNFDPKHI